MQEIEKKLHVGSPGINTNSNSKRQDEEMTEGDEMTEQKLIKMIRLLLEASPKFN